MSSSLATDLNLLSSFLAQPHLTTPQPADCIVICGSSILHCAETIFSALQSNPSLCSTLVICGGKGHSTSYLYGAIARHPLYTHFRDEIEGWTEAAILYKILSQCYDPASIAAAGCRVLVEQKSTNCGSNAIETRKLLESLGVPTPKTMIIVQDPTMSIRTFASFQKCYGDLTHPPQFFSFPTFVPRLREGGGGLVWDVPGVEAAGLWEQERFTDLVIGEIPRLRDDEAGYGPRGKGFIAHVEIGGEVEEAWARLKRKVGGSR
ncbi:MAG: hypothetical protein Q9170_002571 [Blastenia crenularia]